MRRVAVSTARDNFTDLVNEVAYTKEPVTLTRRGRPLAVLTPIQGKTASFVSAGKQTSQPKPV